MRWIANRYDHRVQACLEWPCDICKAAKRKFCTNTIRPGDPLPGRVVHIGRLFDRRRNG